VPLQGLGPSSSELPPVYLWRVEWNQHQEWRRKKSHPLRIENLTSHTFRFFLRLPQILLSKLQVKVELDLLILQLSIAIYKFARFL